jgi:hypothetical protein
MFSQLDQCFAAQEQRMGFLTTETIQKNLEQLRSELTSIPPTMSQPTPSTTPIHVSPSGYKPNSQRHSNF